MNMPLTPQQVEVPAFGFHRLQKVFRSKDGGDVIALRDVGFDVRQGEFVTNGMNAPTRNGIDVPQWRR